MSDPCADVRVDLAPVDPFAHLPRCRWHIRGDRYGFGHLVSEGESKSTVVDDAGRIRQVRPDDVTVGGRR